MKTKVFLATAMALLMLLSLYQTPLSLPSVKASTVYNQSLPSYYYGPRISKLLWTTFATPTAEYGALSGGAIDANEWPLTFDQKNALLPDSRYAVNKSDQLDVVNLPFDAGRYPANFTSFRLAIELLINRADIIATGLKGLGGVLPDQFSPLWPASLHPASIGNSSGLPAGQDLVAANRTLYNDGWRFGFTPGTSSATGHWYRPASDGVGAYAICGKHIDLSVDVNCPLLSKVTNIYIRSDDPLRLYIGTQLASTQGSALGKSLHFNLLFNLAFVTSRTAIRVAYHAPDCGYYSNNCLSSGFPAFTAYTQGLTFVVPDPDGFFWFSYANVPGILDVAFVNWEHFSNSTVQAALNNMWFTTDTVKRDLWASYANTLIDQNAWAFPIYYQQAWNGFTDRLTGFLSTGNSKVPGGQIYFNNDESFWRTHLKGRTYGGSFNLGMYDPITQLDIWNPDSGFIFNTSPEARLIASPMFFDYATQGWLPGLATKMIVSNLSPGQRIWQGSIITPAGFPTPAYLGWKPTGSSPYWTHNPSPLVGYQTLGSAGGLNITFVINSNAKFHDGSSITPNDVAFNFIAAASDEAFGGNSIYNNLGDVNVTGNTVQLFYNVTTNFFVIGSALLGIVPPLVWIGSFANQAVTLGACASACQWPAVNIANTGSGGLFGLMSIASWGDINATTPNTTTPNGCTGGHVANPKNMLDGSGYFTFDQCSTGDPFTVGQTFDLLANNAWVYADPNKAGYQTGIAVTGPNLATSYVAPSSGIPLSVAILSSNDVSGVKFQGAPANDWVPTATGSDVNGATVTAIVAENPSLTVTLTQASPGALYTGTLPIAGLAPIPGGGVYHVQITASKTGSISTTYGPSGSSTASPTGISWEGDPVHTAFQVPSVPVTPIQLFLALITILAIAPIARRTRRFRI